MADYGGTDDRKKGEEEVAAVKDEKEGADEGISKPLMQEEDRNTGQIQWSLYAIYMRAAGGIFWCSVILFALLAEQGAQSTYLDTQILIRTRADSRFSRYDTYSWLVD
jgi:ATP-binding cassette, subfamily C (CFTR/MRP), member 1